MVERFPIDPANPGEVLACGGLAWLAAQADPDAETGFTAHGQQWIFELPFPGASLTRLVQEDPVAAADNVQLNRIYLDWWNPLYGLNPAFKFWAGQQSARSVLTNLAGAARAGDAQHWLEHRSPTTGRLGVDPEGSWESLTLGWSVNQHDRLEYLCRPYVELLAFVALQRFPVQGDRDSGLCYYLWQPAPLSIATLAFAGASRHSLTRRRAHVADSGSNKYLTPGEPLGE